MPKRLALARSSPWLVLPAVPPKAELRKAMHADRDAAIISGIPTFLFDARETPLCDLFFFYCAPQRY